MVSPGSLTQRRLRFERAREEAARAEAQAESFRKMLLAMVRDIRVIMVKLADRTHNMRTLGSVPPAKFVSLLEETGMILAAGRWALHKAVEDIRRWQGLGLTVPLKNIEWKTFLDQRSKLQYKGFARAGWRSSSAASRR